MPYPFKPIQDNPQPWPCPVMKTCQKKQQFRLKQKKRIPKKEAGWKTLPTIIFKRSPVATDAEVAGGPLHIFDIFHWLMPCPGFKCLVFDHRILRRDGPFLGTQPQYKTTTTYHDKDDNNNNKKNKNTMSTTKLFLPNCTVFSRFAKWHHGHSFASFLTNTVRIFGVFGRLKACFTSSVGAANPYNHDWSTYTPPTYPQK